MENKINIVKKELRALKKSSHAVQRIIEIQGVHFKRIRALERLSCDEKAKELIAKEHEIINALRLNEHIEQSENLEKKYMDALNSLCALDKAMMLDCYINGMPYWKIGMTYGFAEEGARKHIEAIIKKIANII